MSGKPLFEVLDDIAPAKLHKAVWETCQSKNWYFGHNSGDGSGLSFWRMDLDGNPSVMALWQHAQPACEKILGQKLKVISTYANGHTYGLGGGFHRDAAMFNPMLAWKPLWAGETVFHDDGGEILAAVNPLPNRGVFFDAHIPHVARPPSRQFGGLRVTVAYKLIIAENAK